MLGRFNDTEYRVRNRPARDKAALKLNDFLKKLDMRGYSSSPPAVTTNPRDRLVAALTAAFHAANSTALAGADALSLATKENDRSGDNIISNDVLENINNAVLAANEARDAAAQAVVPPYTASSRTSELAAKTLSLVSQDTLSPFPEYLTDFANKAKVSADFAALAAQGVDIYSRMSEEVVGAGGGGSKIHKNSRKYKKSKKRKSGKKSRKHKKRKTRKHKKRRTRRY